VLIFEHLVDQLFPPVLYGGFHSKRLSPDDMSCPVSLVGYMSFGSSWAL
jgi:hypothetical protein